MQAESSPPLSTASGVRKGWPDIMIHDLCVTDKS